MMFVLFLLWRFFCVNWTPIHVAAANNSREVLKILFSMSDADCNTKDLDGEAPLHCATRDGYTAIVKVLLHAQGVDANIQDVKKATPLHWAVVHNKVECVSILVKAPGIDINRVDGFKRTPLLMSILVKNFDCTKILLEQPGVNVNEKDIVCFLLMMKRPLLLPLLRHRTWMLSSSWRQSVAWIQMPEIRPREQHLK